ncbi:MAG: hypothetical protein HY817_03775 [Candidatus Abawacabacteria bacterium]|nr:hypothetical protein [Candidatus Abawacabacteria bacterium]
MKRTYLRLIGATIILVFLAACGLSMATYQGNGFTIKHPQDWTASTSDQTKLVTISHANRELRSIDGIITIQGQQLDNNPANAVISANEASLRANSLNQNFQSESVTISGEKGVLWKYDQTTADKKTIYRQGMFAKGGILYTITAAAEPSMTNLSDIEDAIKSFTLTK